MHVLGKFVLETFRDGLPTPVVSNTSISVQDLRTVWKNHELLIPLDPERQRISKYPSRTLARLRTAEVVRLSKPWGQLSFRLAARAHSCSRPSATFTLPRSNSPGARPGQPITVGAVDHFVLSSWLPENSSDSSGMRT